MKLRSGKVNGNFYEGIKQDERIITNSLYYKNTLSYLRYFSKEDIHFIKYSDVAENPNLVMEKLFKYLGVDALESKYANRIVNKGGGASRFGKIFTSGIKLRKKIEKTRYGRKLLNFSRRLGLVKVWHSLMLRKRVEVASNDTEMKDVYQQYLAQDCVSMQKIFSLD